MVAACASKVSLMPASETPQPTIERATYDVSWDLEYGYVFDRAGDRFFPEIAESELPKFEKFFSNANLASIVGKRSYCDCKIAVGADGFKRRVQQATLYAR